MKNNKEKKAGLRGIIIWPVIFSLILIASNVYVLFNSSKAGLFMFVFTVIYILATVAFFLIGRGRIKSQAIKYAKQFYKTQMELLDGLSLPYATLDDSGKIIWADEEFKNLIDKEVISKKISTVFPEVGDKELTSDAEELNIEVVYNNRDYRVQLKKIAEKSFFEALYLFDETRN